MPGAPIGRAWSPDIAAARPAAPIHRPRRPASGVLLAALLAALVAGCASGPAIDTRYTALSQGSRVSFIVLHYTSGDFANALKILTEGPVSSHYLITADDPPTVYRLVDESRRAHHAGVSSWEGMTGLNSSSIGIEIVNRGFLDKPTGPYAPYPSAQTERMVALVRDIAERHQVRPHRIVGHSDIAPTRKLDPGPLFPWTRLFEAGLIPWPDPAQVEVERARFEAAPLPPAAWFQDRLAAHGFAVPRHGQFDDETRDVLIVFQMKYRPALFTGVPDAQTAALLEVMTRPGGLLIVGADGARRAYVK
jgi:N-acetylmuramoyl-L-alanine amidase